MSNPILVVPQTVTKLLNCCQPARTFWHGWRCNESTSHNIAACINKFAPDTCQNLGRGLLAYPNFVLQSRTVAPTKTEFQCSLGNDSSSHIPARKKHNLEPKMTHKRGCFGNECAGFTFSRAQAHSSLHFRVAVCHAKTKHDHTTSNRLSCPHATSVISIGPTLQRAETRTSVPDVVFHSAIHCLSSRLWRPQATSRREWWRSGGSCTKDAARTAADSYTHDLHHSAPHHRDRQLGLSRME